MFFLLTISVYWASSIELLCVVFLVTISLFVSRIMYLSLVYLTGAVPSEYYSLKKRPEYKQYTEEVNMFFPRLPKKAEK